MRDSIWSRTLPAASRATLLASDPLPATADAVVVGAGLVGLCTALSLLRRGVRDVAIVDRTSICGESTGASAGGLWPGHECLAFGSADIVRRARDLHADLRREFECDFVRSGLLALVAEGQASRARERVRLTREAGFQAELLSARELADCEPSLRHRGEAMHFPGDGSIHPLKLAAGIAARLRQLGARICLNEEVRSVNPDGGGIAAASGRVSAGAVVVAAGAWTPLLTELLGWAPPIRPIRGTLMASEALSAGTLRAVVVGKRYYYWQLACGPVAAGGSEEDIGFLEGFSEEIERDIRREHGQLFPSLRGLEFTSCWSGFRPYCEDMNPVIGSIPGTRGAYVSAGHFRKGILLAPLSGEMLAEEILEGRRQAPRSFRPDRFPLTGPATTRQSPSRAR